MGGRVNIAIQEIGRYEFEFVQNYSYLKTQEDGCGSLSLAIDRHG